MQIAEPCDEKSEAFKAGYNTIADIAKERIRRAGRKIREQIEEENRKRKMQLNLMRETINLLTLIPVSKCFASQKAISSNGDNPKTIPLKPWLNN